MLTYELSFSRATRESLMNATGFDDLFCIYKHQTYLVNRKPYYDKTRVLNKEAQLANIIIISLFRHFFYLQNEMYNPCFTMRYTTGDFQCWYVFSDIAAKNKFEHFVR